MRQKHLEITGKMPILQGRDYTNYCSLTFLGAHKIVELHPTITITHKMTTELNFINFELFSVIPAL